MFSKLFSLLLILTIVYVGAVFVVPDIADTYGHREWNEKIRMMKRASELDASVWSGSIMSRATDIAKPYIDSSKTLVKDIQTTTTTLSEEVGIKATQTKQAVDSVQKVYTAVQWARDDMQKLTNFWTGAR